MELTVILVLVPYAVTVVWDRPSRPQAGVRVQHFIGILGTGYLGSARLWDWLGRLSFWNLVAPNILKVI